MTKAQLEAELAQLRAALENQRIQFGSALRAVVKTDAQAAAAACALMNRRSINAAELQAWRQRHAL
jgi:hypothetical protein